MVSESSTPGSMPREEVPSSESIFRRTPTIRPSSAPAASSTDIESAPTPPIPHDDSYFGSVTSLVSDYYNYTRSSVYNASHEASKFVSSYTFSFGEEVATTDISSTPIDPNASTPTRSNNQPRSSLHGRNLSTSRSTSSMDLKWILGPNNNPYRTITGTSSFTAPAHHFRPNQSVEAVRKLLAVVSIEEHDESMYDTGADPHISGDIPDSTISMSGGLKKQDGDEWGSATSLYSNSSCGGESDNQQRISQDSMNKAETASRLAEGTIRALRDIRLSEAIELKQALRYWTERLERPKLYYLECGPQLWFLKKDRQDPHDHQKVVGQKVSQLQAILARRCSCIGELQLHLFRSGFKRGIGQWGILSHQGEWDAVAGHIENLSSLESLIGGDGDALLFVKNARGGKIVTDDSALAAWSVDAIRIVRDQIYSASSDTKPLPFYQNWPKEQQRFDSEHNADEDEANLPLWALDGTSERDAKKREELSDKNEVVDEDGPKSMVINDLSLFISELRELMNSMEVCMRLQRRRRLDKLKPPSKLRRNWYVAAIAVPTTAYVAYNLLIKESDGAKWFLKEVYQKICDFFIEHVSEPLQSIYRELFTRRGREDVTDKKARENTIDILKKMIRSWLDELYPDMPQSERIARSKSMDMSLIEDTKEYSIKNIFEINNIVRMSLIEMQFIKKEMMNALHAMDELMGSNEINIKLAAMTPAFILAKSIQVAGKQLFYVLLKVRKSREATYASFRHIILDIERLLVMRDHPPTTPAPLPNGAVSYLNRESERADKGIGSSMKSMLSDTHPITASHNDSISVMSSDDLGILNCESERVEKGVGSSMKAKLSHTHPMTANHNDSVSVLSSDDLGMLMLLIQECRQILWQDRSRFSRQELRNISEDLAELAGERGAISVGQQLRIIARMCRTYSFLKVVSSGIPFSIHDSYDF